jgi:hypothetical protein
VEAPVLFERRVFTVAWIWGVVSLAPLYFMEGRLGAAAPPAITHPEYFYGFIGCALAWQAVFFLIARQPQALRALMPVAVLEKLGFAIPTVALVALGRVTAANLFFAAIDLTFAVLFSAAYLRGRPRAAAPSFG